MRRAVRLTMRKTSRRRRQSDRTATVDVVTQLECAVRYPQATVVGAVVGGVVPWFARTLAHAEVPSALASGHDGLAVLMLVVVLGCACFSALTVYKFGCATFGDKRKALGFTLAIEGVMLVSQGATSCVALAVLVLINALANGAGIALAREGTCKRRAAAARGAATRAQRRGHVAIPPESAPRTAKSPIVVTTPARPHTTTLARSTRWSSNEDATDAEIVSEEQYS